MRERCEAEQIEQRCCFFSRGQVRKRLSWSITQIRFHLERLRDLEYIAARFGRNGNAFQYELLTDCRETSETGTIGLLDVQKLQLRQQPVGKIPDLSGGCRPPARQVQEVEEQALKVNLSACRVRESGPALQVVMS